MIPFFIHFLCLSIKREQRARLDMLERLHQLNLENDTLTGTMVILFLAFV